MFFADLATLSGFRFETISEVAQPSSRDLLDMATHRMRDSDYVDALNARPEYVRHQVASPPSK